MNKSPGSTIITEELYWDKRRNVSQLPFVNVIDIQKDCLQNFFAGGSDKYSCNKKAFHELMLKNQWKGKIVLDYACGYGTWAAYYALTGAKRVFGFDISNISIQLGNERLKRQKLQNIVTLDKMDATKLSYRDNTFDLVIGHAVIHHVIKYDGIFEELWRVMKPGARAYFLEGLADFWLWKLHWMIKGDVEAGDVPIFSKQIMNKTKMFRLVNIVGDTLLYSIKALWKKRPGKIGKYFLEAMHNIDNYIFRVIPQTRKYGSFSYIELLK